MTVGGTAWEAQVAVRWWTGSNVADMAACRVCFFSLLSLETTHALSTVTVVMWAVMWASSILNGYLPAWLMQLLPPIPHSEAARCDYATIATSSTSQRRA